MLSVGSREDAIKGLGLGVGRGGGGEMEENELEEGEACSIQEDDANINPDVDLAYIDEKIQDILGHFQKDFEGGVSAENLGAKFGGYGSFLPTYQRSPTIYSHPRSPQRVANHNTPTSPSNALIEAVHQNPTVATSESVPLKNSSISKVPSLDGTKKNGTCMSIPPLSESSPQHDLANTTSRSNDQNILKVRIKVSSDNALSRPNAAIYSDMGLEYSPSLSPEDSPGTSGGYSPELQDAPDESPMTIYQIMTCFPIIGGYVLSPLPDSLLHLMENERSHPRDSKLSVHRTGVETLNGLLGDSFSSRDAKASSEKKTKSADKNVKSSEMKTVDAKGGLNDVTGILKKDVDIEMPTARELVSNALDISMQQNSKIMDEKAERELLQEAAKGGCIPREPNKVMSKIRDISPDSTKDDLLVGMASLDTRKVGSGGNGFQLSKGKLTTRTGSSDMALEEGKSSKNRYALFDPHMEGGVKSEKNIDAFKPALDGFKARKDVIVESNEPFELKGHQEASLHEQNSEQLLQVQHKDHSPWPKEKSGNQINVMPPVDLYKENPKAASLLPSKEKKKSAHLKVDNSENKRNLLGPNKESSGMLGQERHKDALGDAKSEHLGKRADLMESTVRDKARDSRTEYEKNALFSEKAKERSDGKKVQIPPVSEALGKSTEIAPLMANGSTSDLALAPTAHVVIEEHWVCCDRCQKWRLLPYGTNPDHLPKKWLCAMLNWLPGMNKCSISEEETTRALHALYQAPLPDNYTANGPNISLPVFTNAQHMDQNHESNLDMASNYGKKRHIQKDSSHVPNHPAHHSHSVKKSYQVSVKSRSLDDMNQVTPQSSSKSSFQHVGKSTELHVKKENDRQKEKNKMEEPSLDGGEFLEQNGKPSKSKNKRDFDQDGFRTSKKVKAEEILGADEDWHSDHDLSGKVASINNNGLPPKRTNKGSLKGDGNSSAKNSKCNSQDSLSGSRKKLKPPVQAASNGFNTFDEGNFDKESTATKRKGKERLENDIHLEMVVGNGLLVDDRANVTEEISESESRKEKRSRVAKADGRDPIANKVDKKIDKKGRVTRVLLSNSREHLVDRMEEENKDVAENEHKLQYKGIVISERNSDCLDSLKRDLPYVQPPTAATSSSSKVSGTRKGKSNFQETRGSPVESVSSSPLRIPSVDKLTNKKNHVGKDEDKDYAVVRCGSLDACQPVDSGVRDPAKAMPNYRDREEAQVSLGEGKDGMHLKACNNIHDDLLPSAFGGNCLVTGCVSTVKHSKYHDDYRGSNRCHNEEKPNNICSSSGFTQRKSGKSSSQPREKHKSSKSEVNKGKAKISDSLSEREDIRSSKKGNGSRYDAIMDPHQRPTSHEIVKGVGNRSDKKDGKKRESVGRQSNEGRRDKHLNVGTQENLEASHVLLKQHRDNRSKDSEVRSITTSGVKSYQEDDPQTITSQEDAKSLNHFLLDRTEILETAHGRGKSQPLSHSGDKPELPNRDPRTITSVTKGDRLEASSADVVTGEASKVLRQPGKHDTQNGLHHSSMRHPTPNGLDAPSPVRRDSNHSTAPVLIKEARDLKHTANRLKGEGLESESTGLYFEAALKFLYVAFLLETESGKHGETTQSMAMYSDTARLCEYCAHEYEKYKDIAAAALAYKCMEVAYMKVIFFKSPCAIKDRHELHTALQMVPTGESPSSSASDVDNLNNHTVEKAASAKGVSSPQVAGNHVIMARNRPNYVRLLNYVQDVINATEASRKSQHAFAAVNASSEGLHYGPEIIASVRQVLDLGFHDVEGLLRLVRLSMNSMSR